MVKFYTGSVMSGKTALLSDFMSLLERSEYLLVVPILLYQNGLSHVKSRVKGYESYEPHIKVDPSFDIYQYVKDNLKENSKIRAIFCEEIQFFNKDHIDQLFKIEEDFNISVRCFGISKNHRNEEWEIVEYLKSKNPYILEIASKCYYCSEPATTNIRYDSNFSAKIVDCLNDNKVEKYLPCCSVCHRLKWKEYEINKI